MFKWLFLVSCIFLSCTLTDDEKFCEFDSEKYEVGESFLADCNTCFCSEDGSVSCTEMACVDEELPNDTTNFEGEYCEVGETKLKVGESYNDGCNTCACTEGGLLMCTLIVFVEETKPINE